MHKNQLERLSANAEWVPVASSLSRLCNAWAQRRDLVVYLGRDGGQGKASAFYDPGLAQIEINSVDAFGDADASLIGDLTDRMELSRFPVAGGLGLHEAMHAKFSTADLRYVEAALSPSQFEVFQLLEELRVERFGVLLYPKDAGYLRASTKTLLMAEGPEKQSPRGTAILLVCRAHVGVLTDSDVAPLISFLMSLDGWSEEILKELYQYVDAFVKLSDATSELADQMQIARDVDALLPKDPRSENESLEKVIEAVLSAAARGAYQDVFEAAEEARAEAKKEQVREEARERKRNEELAQEVFSSSTPVRSDWFGSNIKTRQPTSRERGAAIRLSRALETARYRDRISVETDSRLPPGRLDGAEAMRLSAARWAGGDVSRYLPFKHRERRIVDEPTLTVGIMSDTSGSMQQVQERIGVATYVISEAVYRLENAAAAQVYFGNEVIPGLRKGERLREVKTFPSTGAYEEFDEGFRALDGALDLLNGQGARLLIVASDGEFKQTSSRDQFALTNRWIGECTAKGVAVVWLQLRGQNALKNFPGLEVVTVGDDILDATDVIGQACIRSLATVSGI